MARLTIVVISLIVISLMLTGISDAKIEQESIAPLVKVSGRVVSGEFIDHSTTYHSPTIIGFKISPTRSYLGEFATIFYHTKSTDCTEIKFRPNRLISVWE